MANAQFTQHAEKLAQKYAELQPNNTILKLFDLGANGAPTNVEFIPISRVTSAEIDPQFTKFWLASWPGRTPSSIAGGVCVALLVNKYLAVTAPRQYIGDPWVEPGLGPGGFTGLASVGTIALALATSIRWKSSSFMMELWIDGNKMVRLCTHQRWTFNRLKRALASGAPSAVRWEVPHTFF